MIKSLDFLIPKGRYDVSDHFSKKLMEAFTRLGLPCRHLKKVTPESFADKSRLIVGFNLLYPGGTPYASLQIDAPYHYLADLIKNTPTKITFVDRFYCDFFSELSGKKSFFMPHAVERELTFDPAEKRIYDVVMLGSFINYEGIELVWKATYPPSLCTVLRIAAEIARSMPEVSFMNALKLALRHEEKILSGPDLSTLNIPVLLRELEFYVRGLDRSELLRAVRGAVVHVFGEGHRGRTWKMSLEKNHPNIVFHDSVSFTEAQAIMKKSRIVLNSSPSIKNGAHERVFSGSACGASVLSSESLYLNECFQPGEGVYFYRYKQFEKIDEIIYTILADEERRMDEVLKGRTKVMQNHTWDNRAQFLLENVFNEL